MLLKLVAILMILQMITGAPTAIHKVALDDNDDSPTLAPLSSNSFGDLSETNLEFSLKDGDSQELVKSNSNADLPTVVPFWFRTLVYLTLALPMAILFLTLYCLFCLS